MEAGGSAEPQCHKPLPTCVLWSSAMQAFACKGEPKHISYSKASKLLLLLWIFQMHIPCNTLPWRIGLGRERIYQETPGGNPGFSNSIDENCFINILRFSQHMLSNKYSRVESRVSSDLIINAIFKTHHLRQDGIKNRTEQIQTQKSF